tara:strand:- start:343 stop:828 length:486 start_codon:yes stop_codon:yes gene_type:complete
MNLKQFKLTNNDEIICEVVDREDASDDDDGIVVRKALRIITSEDFDSSIRYYSFKPLVSFQDNIDELVVMNVGHIICETLPSKTLIIHYAKAIKEVEENETKKASLMLDDFIDEIEGMDQEELSDWIHNKMIELTKEEEESIDSDTPGNIITFKPKGGTYH